MKPATLPALLTSAVLWAASPSAGFAQEASRTLAVVTAHADDESPVAPVLARYAREGVKVHLVILTDGAQGAGNTTIPRGPELAAARAAEARCAAEALRIEPPILLGFPDGKLGDFIGDRALLPRATAALAETLAALRPDALITWGPEGGTGHPDHRLVSSMVTQLVRAGAPGVPQRLYYMSIPAEAFAAVNPERGAPPLLVPAAELLVVSVSFEPGDFAAARAALACHQTQYPPETIEAILDAQERLARGALQLSTAFPGGAVFDLF